MVFSEVAGRASFIAPWRSTTGREPLVKVTLDKIASTTRNARIPREVLLSEDIPAKEGIVLAVRVHGTKTVYNQLEDVPRPHDRPQRRRRDRRRARHAAALRGYAGEGPASIKVGDRLDILNLGGVIGRARRSTSSSASRFRPRCWGNSLLPASGRARGRAASIKTGAIPWSDQLEKSRAHRLRRRAPA